MDLIKSQYIEINALGIIILLIMLIHDFRLHVNFKGKSENYFYKMLITNIFLLSADVFIYLLRGHYTYFLFIINNFITSVYFILHLFFGYYWMRYCMRKLYPERPSTKKKTILMSIPIMIGTALIITSPYSHLIFYFNENNRYIRGTFIASVTLLSMVYWIASASLVTYEQVKKKRIRENSLYFTLQIFPLPTLIGTLAQFFLYGQTIVWISSALSLFILFIYLQNNQISRDMLTGLFNRRQMNIQLNWEMKHIEDGNYYLFAIMIDVDKFKYINDNFGHLEGDKALCAISTILKKSCREKDFLARLGGDEFVILGNVKEIKQIDELIKVINENISDFNSKHQLRYSVSLSLGYSYFNFQNKISADELISDADSKMYKNKQSKIKKCC